MLARHGADNVQTEMFSNRWKWGNGVKSLFLIMDKVPQGKESLCGRKGNQPKVKDKDLTPEAHTGKLYQKLVQSFGSYEAWEKDFKATGTMRGIGWAVLYQDILSGNFINFWINEHDVGHPSGGMPILIMDVFEHAFMIDYGLKRADYVESFFKNIQWEETEKRLLLHKA
jgi:superoxide dismutase